MSDTQDNIQVEFEEGSAKFRLVFISETSDWYIEIYLDDEWEFFRGVSNHEARALEACHGVPNLSPGMLAEAVKLLRELVSDTIRAEPFKALDWLDNIQIKAEAFLSKLEVK